MEAKSVTETLVIIVSSTSKPLVAASAAETVAPVVSNTGIAAGSAGAPATPVTDTLTLTITDSGALSTVFRYLPSSPGYQSVRFVLQGRSAEFISPLNRTVQTLELLGSRWLATYTLPPMKRAEAEEWLAFLASLEGRASRFYAGDPAGASPLGTVSGTPVVYGASQLGMLLAVDGWTEGAATLKAGDYVAWNTPSGWRELHILTEDAPIAGGHYGDDGYGGSSASASTGYGVTAAALCISPPIRESPADNCPLITTNPTCVMALAADEVAWNVDEASIYGIEFSTVEAFGP